MLGDERPRGGRGGPVATVATAETARAATAVVMPVVRARTAAVLRATLLPLSVVAWAVAVVLPLHLLRQENRIRDGTFRRKIGTNPEGSVIAPLG